MIERPVVVIKRGKLLILSWSMKQVWETVLVDSRIYIHSDHCQPSGSIGSKGQGYMSGILMCLLLTIDYEVFTTKFGNSWFLLIITA